MLSEPLERMVAAQCDTDLGTLCPICARARQAIGEHLRQRPELFPAILTTLFEIVLFEDCSNQWSLSRPMLSLILINEQIYAALRQQIIASQPVRFGGPPPLPPWGSIGPCGVV